MGILLEVVGILRKVVKSEWGGREKGVKSGGRKDFGVWGFWWMMPRWMDGLLGRLSIYYLDWL